MQLAPRLYLTLAVLLVSATLPTATLSISRAHAQSARMSASDREQARSLFAAGQAAVDAGRWTDALEAFHRAYVLTNAPSALFNAAFALRALGRYLEAEVAFEELLALPSTRPAMRAESSQYLEEIRRRIATVELEGLPDDAITTVHLDGDGQADDGSRPLVLRVDPGHHALDVSLRGRERYEWRGELSDGQLLRLGVVLPPEGSQSRAIHEEAWLWVLIGAAVIGIGGAIAGGVIADQDAQLSGRFPMTLRI